MNECIIFKELLSNTCGHSLTNKKPDVAIMLIKEKIKTHVNAEQHAQIGCNA